MNIDRTGNAANQEWTEQDPIAEGPAEGGDANARRTSPALDHGPLGTLSRSRSLPSRLESLPSNERETTRPRRRIGRSASPSDRTTLANGRTLLTGRPEIRTSGNRRLDIANTHVSTSQEPAGEGHAASMASSAERLAKAFAKMTDVRTLLSQVDDREYIRELRAPPYGDQDEGARLDRLRTHVVELKTHIDKAGLGNALATRFQTRLNDVDNALIALQTDKSLIERAAKVAGLIVLLAPLPLIIPLMTKPRQQKTEGEVVALMAKAMIEGVGLTFTPTTDANLLKDRAMARYFANMVQATEFALPTFVNSLRFLNESVPFNVALGAVSTGALFGGFLSNELRQKYNVWRTGTVHPDLREAGRELSIETKAALKNVWTAVEADRKTLKTSKTAFVANDRHELSPYVSKQVTIAVNAYQRLADELAECIGLPPAGTPAENRDRSAKLALALFSTGVCTATTILMLPDTIGTVDLASDAAFTSALMFSLMADKNVSRQDALEEFKTFVGLSLVMLAVLAANKTAHDFIEHGVSGLLVGSITMAALNLTMPGPVGHVAAQAIEKLMSAKLSDLPAALRDIGDRVYRILAGETPQQRASSVRIEELPPDLESGLPA